MRRADQGQIRIIEAFLSIFIVFSAFAVSANLTIPQNSSRHDSLTSIGQQALMVLDSGGSLGHEIANNNFTLIQRRLSAILPVGVLFNLTIYDEQMRQVNSEVICNGGFGTQNIAYAEAVCVSRDASFNCYILHLRLTVTE